MKTQIMKFKKQKSSNSFSLSKFTVISLSIIFGIGVCGLEVRSYSQSLPDTPKHLIIGKVKPRSGNEIQNSVFSVGFETLDRKLFDPAKCYEPLGKLGVKWARCQTGWNRCETVKGQYDFKWLDEVVDNLLKVGIQPWFNVGYGNKLYTPGAENDSAVGWIPMNSEEAMKGWESFVAALAEHFKGRVKQFELWNEPNVTPFWRPGKPTPDAYVAFIQRSAKVLRSVIPDVVIAGGGFGGFPTDFLKESLKQGLNKYVNKITYHPYSVIPEKNYQQQVTQWRELLSQYQPFPDLWQGECGCPSTNYSVGALSKNEWNESRQARWLLRRVINDLRLNLEMISWYHTCDQAGYRLSDYEAGKSGAYFGLLRMNDYTPKPSYFAYQTMCALFDYQTKSDDKTAMSFSSTDDLKSSIIEQAVFIRHKYPMCAYWLPINVMEDAVSRPIDVTLSVKKGLVLRKPVLIDPLSGEVMKLAGKKINGEWHFSGVPLKDYPMLITDMGAFELAP